MTTIALKGFIWAQIADLFQGVVNFLDSLNKAIAMSRSVQANWEVANMLQSEYKNETVAQIAARLNERSRKDIYGD